MQEVKLREAVKCELASDARQSHGSLLTEMDVLNGEIMEASLYPVRYDLTLAVGWLITLPLLW